MNRLVSLVSSDVVQGLVLGGVLLGVLWRSWRGRFMSLMPRRTATDNDQPLLMTYYTKGHDVTHLASGVKEEVPYAIFMTMHKAGAKQEVWAPEGSLVYRIELPFQTNAHLVGLSTSYASGLYEAASFVASQGLEPVELEGDFSRVFSLYAAPGQQAQARYVFDPVAMEFVMEYCKNSFWEIAGDEMYFASEPGQIKDDVIANSVHFVRHIEPALVKLLPGGAVAGVRHDSPYGQFHGPALHCPLCAQPMTIGEYWQECPNGHGRLLFAGNLVKLRQGKIAPNEAVATAAGGGAAQDGARPAYIRCPHCGNAMTPVDYQLTGVVIDVCTHCAYRWCDAAELTKIAPKA